MRKNIIKTLTLGAIMSMTLVSCNSAKEVDYSTFKEKTAEALKLEVPYTKASVTGTFTASSVSINVNHTYTLNDRDLVADSSDITGITYATTINNFSVTLMVDGESNGVVYKAGKEFSMEYKTTKDDGSNYEFSIVYNQYAMLTSLYVNTNNAVIIDYKVSYSK